MGNGMTLNMPQTNGTNPVKITVKTAEDSVNYNAIIEPADHHVAVPMEEDENICGLEDADEDILAAVRKNIIGEEATFCGPFGQRCMVSCDWVSSSKPVHYIEDFIRSEVLPYYSHTRTKTSHGGMITRTLREEARSIILKAVNGNDEDVVIFTGSGATSAIHKIINVLNLQNSKTAVFIGPYERQSNILPWRSLGVEVVRVKETLQGEVDIPDLTFQLKRFRSRGYKLIASISAASNVTGILTSVDKITEVIHKMGGLAFWDYACAGPHVQIDMNPGPTTYKDAIFISPHNFLGGVGTPGLLIAKRQLFTNEIPDKVGDGAAIYVTKKAQHYLSNIKEREEGGTPAIVESIRAGLTFKLKEAIGSERICDLEEQLTQKAYEGWKHVTNLLILGGRSAKRLPIFSILIGHSASGRFLHYNFVSALLNDLYGIQTHGGNGCAGPYMQDLLCMSEQKMEDLAPYLRENLDENGMVSDQAEIMKPGFTRLSLAYFMEEDMVDFIIQAVAKVATDGWKLLPLYEYDSVTGLWTHRNAPGITFKSLLTAHPKDIHKPKMRTEEYEPAPKLQEVAAFAEKVFTTAESRVKELDLELHCEKIEVLPGEEKLIWFLEPKMAMLYLTSPSGNFPTEKPITDLPFLVRSNTLLQTQDDFKKTMKQMGYTMEDGNAGHPMFLSTFKGKEQED